MYKLDLSKFKSRAVATIESVIPMENVARVVFAFNKMPSTDDIHRVVEANFKTLAPVKNSFRVRSNNGKNVIIAGFITYKDSTINFNEKPDSFKTVANNVFMDQNDNSIWQVVGGSLVRTQTEELAELVSIANIQPFNKYKPIEALASVKDFAGPLNTQVVSYVSPKLGIVIAGVRVSDDEVYSAEEGVVEVAQDQVVDTENLNGSDIDDIEEAKKHCTASTDTNSLVDYYSRLFAYNPLYLEQVIETINDRTIV